MHKESYTLYVHVHHVHVLPKIYPPTNIADFNLFHSLSEHAECPILWSGSAPGFLVNNFVSGTESAETYLKQIQETGQEYNKFNLVLLEKR